MRRPLTALIAAAVTTTVLGAAPALAHDVGKAPTKPATPPKTRLALACAPLADAPSATIGCRWSGTGADRRFELYRKSRAKGARPTLVAVTAETSFADTGVAAGAWFSYQVRAVNAKGRTAGVSKQVKVWCCSRPPVKPLPEPQPKPVTQPVVAPKPASSPLMLACEPGFPDGAPAVTCSWSGLAADPMMKYRLYRKVPGGTPTVIAALLSTDGTSFTDADVRTGATYSYALEAAWRDGRSSPVRSTVVSVACC